MSSAMLQAQRIAGALAKRAHKAPGHRFLSQGTTASSVSEDTADKARKVVVFGGNGFVGQSVCRAALRLGAEVVSISRSGAPAGKGKKSWADAVRWVRGDIFKPENYTPELSGADGVVSCVGGFGSNAHMEKLCGDATVVATEAAEQAGVERFVFVSAAGAQHEHLVLNGYWKGKRKAEAAILERFPEGGVILRASGMYGNRDVGPVTLPLGAVMQPLEMLLNLSPFAYLRSASPLEPVLTPPVAVDSVGRVAAGGALGLVPGGVLLVDDINRLAKDI